MPFSEKFQSEVQQHPQYPACRQYKALFYQNGGQSHQTLLEQFLPSILSGSQFRIPTSQQNCGLLDRPAYSGSHWWTEFPRASLGGGLWHCVFLCAESKILAVAQMLARTRYWSDHCPHPKDRLTEEAWPQSADEHNRNRNHRFRNPESTHHGQELCEVHRYAPATSGAWA